MLFGPSFFSLKHPSCYYTSVYSALTNPLATQSIVAWYSLSAFIGSISPLPRTIAEPVPEILGAYQK